MKISKWFLRLLFPVSDQNNTNKEFKESQSRNKFLVKILLGIFFRIENQLFVDFKEANYHSWPSLWTEEAGVANLVLFHKIWPPLKNLVALPESSGAPHTFEQLAKSFAENSSVKYSIKGGVDIQLGDRVKMWA